MGLSYERSEDVVGWHRHRLGGAGVVESVAVIPGPDGARDDLWVVARRTIDGTVKRYVEFLERDFDDGDAPSNSFFVDSGLSYQGPPVSALSGLGHLEGEEVAILADGAVHPKGRVEQGKVALVRMASSVQVGLGYDSLLQTQRLEAGAADGTAQGKNKRITSVTLRLHNSLGGAYGPSTERLEELVFRDAADPLDSPPPLFTGDKGPLAWPGGYEREGRIVVKQSDPLPLTLLAVLPQVVTADR